MSERKLLFLMTAQQALAFAQLVKTADAGSGDAACRLGDMYREELGGIRYSSKETYRWYGKSALAGDPNGQNNLGACYEHGLGCMQSYAKAVKWYRLAEAQGLSTAAMNLGYCYLRGHGVPADKGEALRLFREAVERGEERAAQEVERLEEASGLRGLQLAPEMPRSDASRPEHSPADTQQARPCVLALGSVPRDGPPENLGAADVVAQTGRSTAAQADNVPTGPSEPDGSASTPAGNASHEPERSRVHLIRGIRFVDETQPGRHLGLVGGVRSPPPWEDEGLRLELLALLSAETVTPADGADGPTDEEVFPIFAEGGLKPDDLVEGIAERYAAYLARQPPTGEAKS